MVNDNYYHLIASKNYRNMQNLWSSWSRLEYQLFKPDFLSGGVT
ncbi:hypothetical protein AEST_03210 [Alishewanella aestuarii B11]|uniref:Uncharacterized protein n=1 Tax=Alishewanella aestuarii B11 TaxID=1197174 RepID=J1YFN1_9ALTE|nr:hypothetical protein AEST_03210 [Alishewanella aestuarii B11]